MSNWIECPCCATDWDLDSMDAGSREDTANAIAFYESAPSMFAALKIAKKALDAIEQAWPDFGTLLEAYRVVSAALELAGASKEKETQMTKLDKEM